jgi:hypothetical protein
MAYFMLNCWHPFSLSTHPIRQDENVSPLEVAKAFKNRSGTEPILIVDGDDAQCQQWPNGSLVRNPLKIAAVIRCLRNEQQKKGYKPHVAPQTPYPKPSPFR